MKIGIYRHYKGKDYQILFVGKHTETLEEIVVYKALYDNQDIWLRPLSMFMEHVEYENKIQSRFVFVREQ